MAKQHKQAKPKVPSIMKVFGSTKSYVNAKRSKKCKRKIPTQPSSDTNVEPTTNYELVTSRKYKLWGDISKELLEKKAKISYDEYNKVRELENQGKRRWVTHDISCDICRTEQKSGMEYNVNGKKIYVCRICLGPIFKSTDPFVAWNSKESKNEDAEHKRTSVWTIYTPMGNKR